MQCQSCCRGKGHDHHHVPITYTCSTSAHHSPIGAGQPLPLRLHAPSSFNPLLRHSLNDPAAFRLRSHAQANHLHGRQLIHSGRWRSLHGWPSTIPTTKSREPDHGCVSVERPLVEVALIDKDIHHGALGSMMLSPRVRHGSIGSQRT